MNRKTNHFIEENQTSKKHRRESIESWRCKKWLQKCSFRGRADADDRGHDY